MLEFARGIGALACVEIVDTDESAEHKVKCMGNYN